MDTMKKISKEVTAGFQKIEDGVVGGYKKIEDGVVGSYKKIEGKFVDWRFSFCRKLCQAYGRN